MSELIEKLGIDWKLLIAQIVNFLILVWVLRRFAYRPISAALERRSQTIAKSLADAKAISQERATAESEKVKLLNHARSQANQLVEQAQRQADELVASSRERAKVEAEQIVSKAMVEADRQKQAVVSAAQAELADIVVASTEKIIRQKIDAAKDRAYIEQTLTADRR